MADLKVGDYVYYDAAKNDALRHTPAESVLGQIIAIGKGYYTCIFFYPDGELMAVMDGNIVRVWRRWFEEAVAEYNWV